MDKLWSFNLLEQFNLIKLLINKIDHEKIET